MSEHKKMGRPTSDPKDKKVSVRLDEECQEILEFYCKENQVGQAEAIRIGIKLLVKKK